ncbi:hypothetical protein CTEN210_15283 [Chaetoceros tenuissimus]|uniref:Nudix hydrolase domain-containing protein n=1 Tax=Chaetoceros tenuissimus TaxID=426638 RepID=A0AAD3D7C8_9STRA|nr:hypothetical protein CTEN210_15283 [Chaetoceros tenuissimus]
MDKPAEVVLNLPSPSRSPKSKQSPSKNKITTVKPAHILNDSHVRSPGQNSASSSTPPLPSSGRIKAPPVCRVPALRKMNMSAEVLSKFCFDPKTLLCDHDDHHDDSEKKNDSKLDELATSLDGYPRCCGESAAKLSVHQWQHFKKNILQTTESRNGRDMQRFATDKAGHLMRLTTGSVPIMANGKILLVSSSRKEEWILPKGGWENDESLAVSALRETFEEGGILGVLGPRLSDVEFETRKAKKRRLELESLRKKLEQGGDTEGVLTKETMNDSSAVSLYSTNSSACHSEDDACQTSETTRTVTAELVSKVPFTTNQTKKQTDDTASLGSIASHSSEASSSHGYVRLSMFPLYVLEVREHWPESGRARKLVDIDTAIEMMKSRPEFHQVLTEVKANGYHLKYNTMKKI